MDLISSRTIDITSLGLDGLSARHKAIASNIANADTPGYKRADVTFEDQLEQIIKAEDFKESVRLQNSADGNPNFALNYAAKGPLNVNLNQAFMEMSDFNPQTVEGTENSPNTKGNTVNIEQEMSFLTRTGMTYNALATLQSKEFKNLSEIIRTQG